MNKIQITNGVSECCGKPIALLKFAGEIKNGQELTHIKEGEDYSLKYDLVIRIGQCEKCKKLFLRKILYGGKDILL